MSDLPDDIEWLLQRAENLGRSLRAASVELARVGARLRARAETVQVVDVSSKECAALGKGLAVLPRHAWHVLRAFADETKATVVAMGRLLGGIDAYYHACEDRLRGRLEQGSGAASADTAAAKQLLELLCEHLVHSTALCCHAIVRARWAEAIGPESVDEDLLLAHCTDMPAWLWERPKLRRGIVWCHHLLEDRPLACAAAAAGAAAATGLAVLLWRQPWASPLASDPAFAGPPMEGGSSSSSSSSTALASIGSAVMGLGSAMVGIGSAMAGVDMQMGEVAGDASDGVVWFSADAVRGSDASSPDVPSLRRVVQDATVSKLSKAVSSSFAVASTKRTLHRAASAATPLVPPPLRPATHLSGDTQGSTKAHVDVSPSFRSPADPESLFPPSSSSSSSSSSPAALGGAGEVSTDEEALAWLANATDISSTDVVHLAAENRKVRDSASFTATGAAAAAATLSGLAALTLRSLGHACTPQVSSRCRRDVERAAEAAARGAHELGQAALGAANAAAVRLRAWQQPPLEALHVGSAALPEVSVPHVPSLHRGGVGARWEVAVGAVGQSVLSEVGEGLADASSGAASLGRFLRAMPRSLEQLRACSRREDALALRRRRSRSRRLLLQAGRSSASLAGCGEGDGDGADADDDDDDDEEGSEESRAASSLIRVARGTATVEELAAEEQALNDAAAAAAAAATTTTTTTTASTLSEQEQAGERSVGRRSNGDHAGTGATRHRSPSPRSTKTDEDGDGDGEVRVTGTLLAWERLGVAAPSDATLQRVLARIAQAELINPSAAVRHDDEAAAPDCAFCLEPMRPHDALVRSQYGPCGRFHVFHRDCFTLQWAHANGCPLCRAPVHALAPAAVDTPFLLHERRAVHR